MDGLSLDWYLRLTRLDARVWIGYALATLVLAALALRGDAGPKRLARRCLAVSLIAHLGIVLWGSELPVVRRALWPVEPEASAERIQRIELVAVDAATRRETTNAHELAPWDQPGATPAAPDPGRNRPERVAALQPPTEPELPVPAPEAQPDAAAPAPAPTVEVRPDEILIAEGEPEPAAPDMSAPIRRPSGGASRAAEAVDPDYAPTPDVPAPAPDLVLGLDAPAEADAAVGPFSGLPDRTEPRDDPPDVPGAFDPIPGEVVSKPARSTARAPAAVVPKLDVRGRLRAPSPRASTPTTLAMDRSPEPKAAGPSSPLRLDLPGVERVDRGIAAVPEVYRLRLDPDRTRKATRDGADAASEEAVARALRWLTRHQDADGRWDGGTLKYRDGSPVTGQDDHTAHCRGGAACWGTCHYWEADTALTGLALLAFLGAGQTHREGPDAATVRRGLEFLLSEQKPDGDLRGPSVAVGMYCHGMASLALVEAYALTGDPALRRPANRAVAFLIAARSGDGDGWRYRPKSGPGDTSVLGWVVLVLKSAQVAQLDVADEGRDEAVQFLTRVRAGAAGGLARYQQGAPVSASMTAEAWASRQFLGIGGPGPASDEAARYLLARPPDRDPPNYYAWYYATLALHQHGGEPWRRWDAAARPRLVALQRTDGCAAGSWDPDATKYGAFGGRIMSTALATLSLEVYYRYLRMSE